MDGNWEPSPIFPVFSYLILFSVADGYVRGWQLGAYCGRTGNTAPLISSRNVASVKFTTDYSVNRTGFALQYKAGKRIIHCEYIFFLMYLFRQIFIKIFLSNLLESH